MKIGFFDSGLGGLTILRSVIHTLPEYDYFYFGDTLNLPYGDKSEEQIYQYATEALSHLFDHGVVLAVIACNTASAETLRRLQDTFIPEEYPDRKVLGVIIPTIEEIVDSSMREVLLIATKRTVDSGKYHRELEKHPKGTEVNLYACATPGLVSFIESGEIPRMCDALTELLNEFIDRRGEVLVLGCTHYTLLKDELRRRYGRSLQILSQDEIIPKKLKEYLSRHSEIEARLSRDGARDMFLSDESSDYGAYTKKWINI